MADDSEQNEPTQETPSSPDASEGASSDTHSIELSEKALRGGFHAEVVSFEPVADPTTDAPGAANAAGADAEAPSSSEGSGSAENADA